MPDRALRPPFLLPLGCLLLGLAAPASARSPEGYYRYPALWRDTIVFTAEGDLWAVGTEGGVARRLTTHPEEETHAAISPDGQTVAFSASYEGPTEVYTMPLAGGVPVRRTWEMDASTVVGYAPDGRLVYSTQHLSTLPDPLLVALDPSSGRREPIPLAAASDGAWDPDNGALFFARPEFHRNNTKRYRGGTARDLWRFAPGDAEATNLTADYPGGDHSPMVWQGRVYFLTDRDGTVNVWSMDEGGGDLRQETSHAGWDVKSPSLAGGRVVYQLGADLWLLDLAAHSTHKVPITLASDFDQLRERWIKDPLEYLTSVDLHPHGDSVLLTARGRVFVVPVSGGRQVQLTRAPGVRHRDAVYMPDGDHVLLVSDETGELELELQPASGVGSARTLTHGGHTVRFGGAPSPDGAWVAFDDLDRDLYLLNETSGEQKRLNRLHEGVGSVAWSPDSRWLVFEETASNQYTRLQLYDTRSGSTTAVTSDRVNSISPAFSPDGKWLFFLSDRELRSVVGGPWGQRQPEPFFDKEMAIFQVALRPGARPSFRAHDELAPEGPPTEGHEAGKGEGADQKKVPVAVEIELEGLEQRLWQLPIPAGNYAALKASAGALFWLSADSGIDGKSHLVGVDLSAEKPDVLRVVEDVSEYRLSADGKKLLVRKRRPERLFVVDAQPKEASKLADHAVDLSGLTFPLSPREDFRQMFIDAWRLERDFFWASEMNGLDWRAVRDKYLPLVDRVTNREELSDLIGEVVAELSALHVSVRGGEFREGPDQVVVASLGARLARDEKAGGDRIEHIYRTDPDYPSRRAPLADPYLGVSEGDLITEINGVAVLSVPDSGALLRNQQGKQVRLRVRGAAGERDVIVVPTDDERDLRYEDWELSRRDRVEQLGHGDIGYLHLRAMTPGDLEDWYRSFYPVFKRGGLIIDVRHNRGGNIDSILLEKLMRRAWFYWKDRVGEPYWNMQYAFRGHLVVLIDEDTASDGEAFAEGIRRLGLGELMGVRTWGGEIWLSSNNRLSDGGLARAPQSGVYGPEGKWLIEGWGVEPDIEVRNLPHATFEGRDAQLEAAVARLQELMREDPRPVPPPPPYPDKSFQYPRSGPTPTSAPRSPQP